MPKRILSFFRNLFRKRVVDQALEDELRSTLDALIEEKMQQGFHIRRPGEKRSSKLAVSSR